MFSQSRLILLTAAAVVAALGAMASTASANMILNGDFSVNASAYTGTPGYDGAGNPATPSDWVAVAPATYGGVGVNGPDTTFSTTFAPGISNNILPPGSGAGSQDFAFLQSGTTTPSSGVFSPASMSQSFNTVAGGQYTVTFDAAQRGTDINVVLQVQVLDPNQNLLASATSGTGGGLTINANSWTSNVLNFTADGTSTTLAFADGPNSYPGEAVDFTNVSVAAVPEPATLELMVIGVAPFGLLLLKRRNKA